MCVYTPVDVLQLHIRNRVELVFLEIYFLWDREDATNDSNLTFNVILIKKAVYRHLKNKKITLNCYQSADSFLVYTHYV